MWKERKVERKNKGKNVRKEGGEDDVKSAETELDFRVFVWDLFVLITCLKGCRFRPCLSWFSWV